MKKLLSLIVIFAAVSCAHAQTPTGDEILRFVRENLPNEPLKLTGSLKVKAKNGFTSANIPTVMELNWGAAAPTAEYRLGAPGSRDYEQLTITWNNDKPSYAFSNSKNKPTDTVLNTGISWADLSFSVLWWPNAKLTGEETKIQRDCYVVEVPVPDSKNTMRLWIEKDMGMLLEARTLDSKAKELSRLKIVSIKKMDEMWIAKDLELTDQKTGSKTTLVINDLEWINGPPTAEEEPTAEAFSPADSVNQLAVDLYNQLSAEDGNLFFSPYSISSALAMTYGGARGETAEQMNTALHFGGPDITHPAFSYLRRSLNKIEEKGDVQLAVANALWPQKDYKFSADYLALTQTHYDSSIHSVDYKADTEGARKAINSWVKEQTKEKIKDLIGEDALDELTRLTLVNAIYFKGNWAEQFDPNKTREASFHLSADESVQVPMMSQTADFKLAQNETMQALELPYQGDDLSMIILLPNEGEKLEWVDPTTLQFSETEVMVQLPKFKMETAFNLNDTLTQMGMTDAFSDKADFSGMTDAPNDLFIGGVLHKAFIEVNEEGTEAAASTALFAGSDENFSLPQQFIADRPFLFCIRENSTGTLLFMGRVMNPEA
ncbi:MAG: outer membrane lipoprotein-sorting protein [Pontiellaceae bacterium]|nr:outer membrane lipoprotein-sorting protein [Pontiellaceae bacterium]